MGRTEDSKHSERQFLHGGFPSALLTCTSKKAMVAINSCLHANCELQGQCCSLGAMNRGKKSSLQIPQRGRPRYAKHNQSSLMSSCHRSPIWALMLLIPFLIFDFMPHDLATLFCS